MIIAALNESRGNETRVAITPNAIKHYKKLGFEVLCEKEAGTAAGFTASEYEQAGAMLDSKKSILNKSQVLLCINEPSPENLSDIRSQTLIIAPIDNDPDSHFLSWCCKEKITAFSMNMIPRISRAQSMDSLSSQANLAGYRAVLEGINHFNRVIPMMMTAAGMIQPAKILILGAGVAGLQAIATAKRLGAIVYAFDVRRAAKEQVESLGAEFIEVSDEQDSETRSGYAREMSKEYQQLQAELIDQYAKRSDIIICTALIPNKKAPLLITKKTVNEMKPGSVIVDLATAKGGNCELSVHDKIIRENQVTIVGYSNMAGLVATTASELYANNLVHLLNLLTVTSPPNISFDKNDDIIKQALLCHDGIHMPFQTLKEN